MDLAGHLGMSLHERSSKPRSRGLNSVIDTGVTLGTMRDHLADLGDYIDSVKLVVAHLFEPVERTREKTALLAEYGIPVQPSGTYIEVARTCGHEEETLARLRDVGVTRVEVSASSGTELETEDQLRFAKLAHENGFEVVGEVGAKWAEGDTSRRAPDQIDVDETVRQMQSYLEAGVEKFFWEGQLLKLVIGATPDEIAQRRESALEQMLPVVEAIGQDHIIFETSGMFSPELRKLMFLWFIRFFGPEVNIGNVRFEDVGFLEGMRRGIAPAKGMGRAGAFPWIRSVEAGGGTASARWWEEGE